MSIEIEKVEKTIEEKQALVQKAFSLVDEAAKSVSLEFRTGQRDICTVIVAQYLIDPSVPVILEAPTGSGKSIIAMICAMSINSLNKNHSAFILTSDKLLQKQYDRTLENVENTKTLFGKNNYNCERTSTPFNDGFCAAKRISRKIAKSLDCYGKCGYFQALDKAIVAKIAVLNYNNWLLHQNLVNAGCEEGEGVIFNKRTATFFDESHKIRSIVQDMFAASIYDASIIKNMDAVVSCLTYYAEQLEITLTIDDANEVKKRILDLTYGIAEYTDGKRIIQDLTIILQFLRAFTDECSPIQAKNQELGEKAPNEMTKASNALENLLELMNKIYLFIDAIVENFDNCVIDVEKSQTSIGNVDTTRVLLRNVDESCLVDNYVLKQANFKVFMSASLGNLNRFAALNGIKSFKALVMPSTFKFENSTIMKVCKFNLANKHKASNIGPSLQFIDNLINHPAHANQRGLIHTGNFEFMRYIKANSKYSDRLLIYNNSFEKEEILAQHALSDNKILMGPSLVEGVDLPDDLCRFMIMFKVPYLNLTDNLVIAKMNQIEGWYEYETVVSMIQMLGRPIRHENDFCTTYLVDTNFTRFFDKNDDRYFPQYIRNRIK